MAWTKEQETAIYKDGTNIIVLLLVIKRKLEV